MLVPLTSSLYVAGVLDPTEKVLVDIGTSFFVGKSAADAKELLARKAALLKENTETLSRVISSKRGALQGGAGVGLGVVRVFFYLYHAPNTPRTNHPAARRKPRNCSTSPRDEAKGVKTGGASK